jgi:predicted Fe-Mo cluster-binding NifX family protein
VTGRNAGRYCFLEAELILRTHDLRKAETVCERIEASIRREVPHVERVLIHSSPVMRDEVICAIPVNNDGTMIEESFSLSSHFFVTTLNSSSGKIAPGAVYENPFVNMENGRGVKTGQWLLSKKIDYVMTRKDISGVGLGYALSSSGVEIKMTSCVQVVDALSELQLSLTVSRQPVMIS